MNINKLPITFKSSQDMIKFLKKEGRSELIDLVKCFLTKPLNY